MNWNRLLLGGGNVALWRMSRNLHADGKMPTLWQKRRCQPRARGMPRALERKRHDGCPACQNFAQKEDESKRNAAVCSWRRRILEIRIESTQLFRMHTYYRKRINVTRTILALYMAAATLNNSYIRSSIGSMQALAKLRLRTAATYVPTSNVGTSA
mmetsp:Transcript_7818/g.15306  ORF Transcript_7818/g.15306 Transcript_7818/m.15306 type:complete len:156 (-) Transcript_7818:955-1422(-)